jgi:hypothetical protein
MGKLFECEDCGKNISKKAKSCPNCGRDCEKKKSGCLNIILLFLFVIFSIVLFSLVRTDEYVVKDIEPVKNVSKVVKNWDDGLDSKNKQKLLDYMTKSTGSKSASVNEIESLMLECTVKIMIETLDEGDDIYISKNRDKCITFMNGFYSRKLLDDKNLCLNHNWSNLSEKTIKYKKYCNHYFGIYFKSEIKIFENKTK